VAPEADERIKALKAHAADAKGLHEAHRGDINKAVAGLQEKVRAAERAQADLEGEIKASILSVSRRLAETEASG
jgi:hypothetical protein